VSVPPLALRRCPRPGCALPLRATLEAGRAPVLACERLHLWVCLRDPEGRMGWRLVAYVAAVGVA
jgi:hypothetical protein